MRTQHGADPLPDPPVEPPQTDPPLVRMSFPRHLEYKACPLCHGGATNRTNMRRHFSVRHGRTMLHINGDPIPHRCELCGMLVTPNSLQRGHRNSAMCRAEAERVRTAVAIRRARAALDVKFYAYGQELERVETFKYLGRLLSSMDSDWPALYSNLKKARQKWARLSCLLAREGASPRVSSMFYKAIIQSVLLYGSETWVISSSMLKTLEGFHSRVARRLTGRRPRRRRDGTWSYPDTAETLRRAGLEPMAVYLDRRRQNLQAFVQGRHLHNTCTNTERLPGTPTGTKFWWEIEPLVGEPAAPDVRIV